MFCWIGGSTAVHVGAWSLNPGPLFDKAPHAEQSECCLIAVVKQSYNLGLKKTDDILYRKLSYGN